MLKNVDLLKKTTINNLKSNFEELTNDSKYRIHISNAVYENSTVSYYLIKGMIIICDKTKLTPLTTNLEEISDGYKVINTGVVQLLSTISISESYKPLLTILS